ncbi:hypothetical protein MAR_019375 [Mya arenaria]|uniref:Uncharacterized protein n=1 Tax=Mya arenaria TaxID=6604 RepID=A0ABY7EKD0_MYAAR|nr:hypothetical protein MAR_019375 [Mya arenaria]
MLKSAEEWHKMANAITSVFDAIRFQARLIEYLVKAADYPYPEICRIEQSLLDLISIRQGERNLVTYKNHSFRSVYTGKMIPPQPKPYMENTDDSLEAYLGQT